MDRWPWGGFFIARAVEFYVLSYQRIVTITEATGQKEEVYDRADNKVRYDYSLNYGNNDDDGGKKLITVDIGVLVVSGTVYSLDG